MELQSPPLTLNVNVLVPLTLPFYIAGIAVYPKVKEMWTFCQKKRTHVPTTLKGRPSSFIYLLPAFIPMLTFFFSTFSFDF